MARWLKNLLLRCYRRINRPAGTGWQACTRDPGLKDF